MYLYIRKLNDNVIVNSRTDKGRYDEKGILRRVPWDAKKYAGDFATVYNAAWAQHGEAKEITEEQVLKMFQKMKAIMDPRLLWFAYYKDEPIDMFINIPDINQYFKYFNCCSLHLVAKGLCKIMDGCFCATINRCRFLGRNGQATTDIYNG